MLKKIGYGLLVLMVILIGVGIYGVRFFNNLWFQERPLDLSYTYEDVPISMEWVAQEQGDVVEEHAAIIIPAKIVGLPYDFYFQWDTGHPTTVIYGNTLNSIQATRRAIATSMTDETRFIDSLQFSLGGNLISASKISIMEDYGPTFSIEDTLKRIKLGTIGADFHANRITVVDFKNKYLKLLQEADSTIASISCTPFDFQGRRFMLKANLFGKDHELFYDSGSSAFGLLTSKDRYMRLTDKHTEELSYGGNHWGDTWTMYHRPSSSNIVMGNTSMPLERVSYVDVYAPFQKFMTPFTRIGGWLGNKPFLDYVLIFDLVDQAQFAVISNDEFQELN